MKKTRIVCTIGPITADAESLKQLRDAGMNVVRLNGSHNTLEWHEKTIKLVREVDPFLPILVDLPGRKIRTCDLPEPVAFKKGETIILTSDSSNTDKTKVAVKYANLHADLSVGNNILADDGTLKFEVIKIEGREIHCRAYNSGALKSCKGINVPYVKVNTDLISTRDKEVMALCMKEGVDFVGVSFVESREHVLEVQKCLEGSSVRIISKVENQFGIDNLSEILEESYGILIDRGDLGAETKISTISVQQKKILKQANKMGKPVIVATEMLHTMIENPFPTKAEINDITNAILDGGSAIMMSGETAVGEYPIDACRIMAEVAVEAENYLAEEENKSLEVSSSEVPNVIGKCVLEASRNLPISKIICVTKSGFASRMVARYRMKQDIVVVTDSIEKCRKFNLYWGVTAHHEDVHFVPEKEVNMVEVLHSLYQKDVLTQQDVVVATAVRFPNPEKSTKMNYLEIHDVSDLKKVFNWK